MPKDLVQIRITSNARSMELPEGRVKRGDTIWVSRDAANAYINKLQIAEPVGASIGPSETKPGEPSEKKESAVAETAGLSTDSAKSAESGVVTPSSALRPGRASTVTNAKPSAKRGRPAKPK